MKMTGVDDNPRRRVASRKNRGRPNIVGLGHVHWLSCTIPQNRM